MDTADRDEPGDEPGDDVVDDAGAAVVDGAPGGHGSPAPQPGAPLDIPDEVPEGEWMVKASLGGTALFTVTALAATAVPEPLVYVSVPVALVLFALGAGAFLLAYWNAVQRSRASLIGIGGLYFLAGCAPRRVRNLMNLSLAVEVGVAFLTASIRVFTPLAFGLLVPMFALGMSGLWASRFGVFPPRPPDPPRPRRTRSASPTPSPRARREPPAAPSPDRGDG